MSESNNTSIFSNNIALLRKSKRLSQRSLATELGVSKGTIGNWEVDKTLPPMETIERVAEFFGVEVYELFLPIRDEKPVTEANLYAKAISMLARTEAAISKLEESLSDIPEEDYERQITQNDIGMMRDNYINVRKFVGELFGKSKLDVARDVDASFERTDDYLLGLSNERRPSTAA